MALANKETEHAPCSRIEGSLNLDLIEDEMLKMPEVNCPVAHHFGPGVYIREVTLPAGVVAIGHEQKFEHLNVLLKGKVAMVDGASVKVVEAPLIFTGKPGRKVGYIMEECVWQNIYATTETDIEKLESTYLKKSDTWNDANREVFKLEKEASEPDRLDYLKMLEEYGFTDEEARNQSENESDQIPMPREWASIISIRPSPIDGNGMFISSPIRSGTIIAPAKIKGFRTPAGRYVNHSLTPNCKYEKSDNGDLYLVAIRDVNGCMGGTNGEELTVCYRQARNISQPQVT